jgi:AraC-like DNA-binding protein
LDRVARAKPRFATIKVRNVAAALPTLVELGADPDAVLRSVGIQPEMFSDPGNDLPFAAVGKLLGACVRATGCESFALRAGARRNTASIGPTGLLSMHAPTVRDALQVISGGIKTSNTGVATMLEERGDVASLQYVVTAPNIENSDQIVDAAIAVIVNMMRQLCGPPWRPTRVRLTRDPPRDRTPFAQFFGVPIEFGVLTPGVIFDAVALDWPVRDSNPDYAKILAQLHEDAIADAEGDFISAVKSVMRATIGSGAFTRDGVCRALGLNARTLANRLEAFGVTFSGLADEVRFDAAQSLLLKSRRIGEIAADLGFAEPSAFIRAFKAWSGTTPGRWRAAKRNVRPPIDA